MINGEEFWLVWCKDGGEPRQKHSTYQLAAREAQRLAQNNPGREFVVLQPVHGFATNNLVQTDYSGCEIPF